jgi:hypothetical protein
MNNDSYRKIDYTAKYMEYLDRKVDFQAIYNDAVEKNSGIISPKSQEITAIIPNNSKYKNSSGMCKQLSVLSTDLFFRSSSLTQYTKIFSHILDQLMKKSDGSKVNYNFRFSTYDSSQNVLEKYSSNPIFVRSEDISKKIMKYAVELEDTQKIAIILAIGNHAINVMLANNKDSIHCFYYDPNFGQFYMQITTKAEIVSALKESNNMFVHPKSILNEENVLLGKLLIHEESVFDLSTPVFMNIVTTKSDINGTTGTINKTITLPKNISEAELVKYFATTLNPFLTISYVTPFDIAESFLMKFHDKTLSTSQKIGTCHKNIINCSEFVKNFLAYTQLRNGLEEYLPADKRSKSKLHEENMQIFLANKEIGKIVDKKKGAVCNNKEWFKKEYYKITNESKKSLYEYYQKCLSAKNQKEIDTIAKDTCKLFASQQKDANNYATLKNKYYDRQDAAHKIKDNNEVITQLENDFNSTDFENIQDYDYNTKVDL